MEGVDALRLGMVAQPLAQPPCGSLRARVLPGHGRAQLAPVATEENLRSSDAADRDGLGLAKQVRLGLRELSGRLDEDAPPGGRVDLRPAHAVDRGPVSSISAARKLVPPRSQARTTLMRWLPGPRP